MKTIIELIIIGIIFYVAYALKQKNEAQPSQNKIPEKLPYEKKMLLTKAEYSFYLTLKDKCDKNNLLICPKVRMEDFINVTDKQNHSKYRGYIKSRHIDFLICDNKLRIIAGIELDDNTHKNEKVKNVDELKQKIFEQISLPLFRIKMSDGYYKEQIQEIINTLTIQNQPKTEEQKRE